MIVRRCIRNLKHDRDLRKERPVRAEGEPVQACLQGLARRHQLRNPASAIRNTLHDQLPLARATFQSDGHPGSGSSLFGIENMGTNAAHDVTSLSSRMRVIWLCSVAAVRNSSSAPFDSRDLRISSIS